MTSIVIFKVLVDIFQITLLQEIKLALYWITLHTQNVIIYHKYNYVIGNICESFYGTTYHYSNVLSFKEFMFNI